MKTLVIFILLFIGNSIKSYSEIPFVWQNDTLTSNFVNLNDKLFMQLNTDYKGLSVLTFVNVDVNTGEINENLFLPKFESIAYSNDNSVIIIEQDQKLYKLDSHTYQIIEEINLPFLEEGDNPTTFGITLNQFENRMSQNRYLLIEVNLFYLEENISIRKSIITDLEEKKMLREFITNYRDKEETIIGLEGSQFEFSKDGTKFIRLYQHNQFNDNLGKLEIYSFPDFELLDELYSSERVGQAEYSEIKFFPTNNKIILRKDSIYHYYDEKIGKNRIKNIRLTNFDIYNLTTLEIEEKFIKPVDIIKNSQYSNFYTILNNDIIVLTDSENENYRTIFYNVKDKNSFELDIFNDFSLFVLSEKLSNNFYFSRISNGKSKYGVIDISSLVSNIENGINNTQITIFPNPSNNSIDLLNQSEYYFNELLIYNSNGELISSKNINLQPQMTINLDISNLVKGAYILNLKNEDTNVSNKFIKD